MTTAFTIALAQQNPTVGDIAGNAAKILAVWQRHRDTADLVVTGEMSVTGYPTDDLTLKPFFIDHAMRAVHELAQKTAGGNAGLLVGAPWRDAADGKTYNAVLLLHNGAIAAIRYKHDLPNYGVFDEYRVFAAGPLPEPVAFRGAKLGVMICEDMWHADVATHLKKGGAEILVVPNGSPYEAGKHGTRLQQARSRITETGLPLVYVNQVGGQDELVFDGASFALAADGKVLTQLPSHREYESVTIWRSSDAGAWQCISFEAPHTLFSGTAEIYQSLVLGLRDYVDKNGFLGVLLGMSGGIDSALSAAIAVDALGAGRVRCFMLPSPYTSQESLDDAADCAGRLGIAHGIVDIQPAMQAFDTMITAATGAAATGTTAENIQARARGVLLMALSNSTGDMVLSTGNKSEMSVGYATLYGDMCGGFNVLKDVYKMTVFALAEWRNASLPAEGLGPAGEVITPRIISKPPSAELRPDQKDEDSLPPYAALDEILQSLVEHEMPVADIVALGHSPETVNRVWQLLDRAEYKRRQACPGVKISRKAFGRDRRYPITNKFTNIRTDD